MHSLAPTVVAPLSKLGRNRIFLLMSAAATGVSPSRNLSAMSFKALLDAWLGEQSPELSEEHYSVRLPVDDAARLAALTEMFPGTTPERLITDLLHTGLDEIEAAMPYVEGTTVIREDEFGDPVYEDVGMTPRFLDLVKNHRRRLDKS